MFAIRLRVRPCRARSGPRLVARLTVRVASSWTISIRSETSWLSSPFGPLTVTRRGPIGTVTPSGTGMGCLPILLIRSPDVCDDLAADALRLRLVAGHHPGGRGHDRRAH